MAPPEPPTTITLKVKVPPGYVSNNGSSDEFALGSLPVSTTIGAVRHQIQQLIPSHPTPDRQRLLYGGRALVDNEQTLADALNTKRDATQTEYVVHLLVRPEGAANAPTPDGHRRGASMPSTPIPATGQQQPQLTPADHEALHAQQQQQHIMAHNQNMRRMMDMQQQHQRAMGNWPPAGVHFPQGAVAGGMPNFGQAVAQGQQQRAAMGMQGLGGQNGAAAAQQPNAEPVVNGAQFVDALRNATPVQQQQPSQAQQAPGTEAHAHAHAHAQAGNTPQQAGHHQQQPQQQQQQQRPPGRPISGQGFHLEGVGPNGQRFQFHHQTLNIPGAALPGQGLFGMPQMPGFMPQMPMPAGFPQQQGQLQAAGPSALDRAHENIAEMRRMLEEMRNANGATDEQRTRIADLEQRVQNVNGYIDPFNFHRVTTAGNPAGSSGVNTGRQSAPPSTFHPNPQQPSLFATRHDPQPFLFPPGSEIYNHAAPRSLFNAPPATFMAQRPSDPNEVTCYLLSGPQGPQALVFSPQHGAYTGGLPAVNSASASHTHTHWGRMTPTQTTTAPATAAQQPGQQALANLAPGQPAGAAAGVPNDPVAAAAAQHLANGQARQQAAEAAGPLQPVLNNMWLLLRLSVFAYFILGSNLGWRRPVVLVLVGMGYWIVRAGLFGEGGVVRRWWEGVMRVGPPAGGAGAGGADGGQVQQAEHGDGGAAPGVRQQQVMPTPEQVAQRLVHQRNAQANARVGQLRELVRPVERAVALFVASLWPGVGEAAVRAREDEERRRNEEEVAGRRRVEEDERGRREAEEVAKEKEKGEVGGAGEGAGKDKGTGSVSGSTSNGAPAQAEGPAAGESEETAGGSA
ncbi:hypothetical protein LTR36_000028 [Oleoguttula mirabilis]|uniref:Ubiquitin-like domain-containing protein n=1 Tax=Oleoguttula mirabilis TaxID=1507867 RepID=A0AAV9JXP1_9PEZI|nr:hypothetical protein LTR36_000028 [Oleoguttula mirabilis]